MLCGYFNFDRKIVSSGNDVLTKHELFMVEANTKRVQTEKDCADYGSDWESTI